MTTFTISGSRGGEIVASERTSSKSTARTIADSWRGGCCDSVDVVADVDPIREIQAVVNSDQPWLSIEPAARPDGRVDLVVGIHGRFNAVADSASPLDVAKALGGLFGSLHGSVVAAAGC